MKCHDCIGALRPAKGISGCAIMTQVLGINMLPLHLQASYEGLKGLGEPQASQ